MTLALRQHLTFINKVLYFKICFLYFITNHIGYWLHKGAILSEHQLADLVGIQPKGFAEKNTPRIWRRYRGKTSLKLCGNLPEGHDFG